MPVCASTRCGSLSMPISKSAARLYLETARRHDISRRLCTFFHAASSGRGGAGEFQSVQRHDGGGDQSDRQPAIAGAIALFRRRRRSENCFRLHDVGVKRLHRARSRPRRLLQNREGLTRQRPIRPGAHPQRFNYAKGVSQGIEFSAKFHSGNFQAYANVAVAQEKATQPVSNQFLFDNATPLADLGGLTEFQYLSTHWIYTDHNQYVTGSAG